MLDLHLTVQECKSQIQEHLCKANFSLNVAQV